MKRFYLLTGLSAILAILGVVLFIASIKNQKITLIEILAPVFLLLSATLMISFAKRQNVERPYKKKKMELENYFDEKI